MSSANFLEQVNTHLSDFKTPCYIYNAAAIRENYRSLKERLGTELMMSVKANHCTDLLHLLSSEIDGFEVASEYELNAFSMFKSEQGFINNPTMSPGLMKKAAVAKATITLDHPAQIDALLPLKNRLKPVFLRLNTSLVSDTPPTPRGFDHFGMDQSSLHTALQALLQADIQVGGVHIFTGSYQFEKQAFQTLSRLPAVIKQIEDTLGYRLQAINLGGGFAPLSDESTFDWAGYRQALSEFSDYRLMHESGRGIFASAGYFMTTVTGVKSINEQAIVLCDGGMAQNFMLAQTENVIKKLAEPERLTTFQASGESRETLPLPAKVVGSTCNHQDVIGTLPAGHPCPAAGDKLLFSGCGAYNRTYSPTQFLGLAKASEYVMDN